MNPTLLNDKSRITYKWYWVGLLIVFALNLAIAPLLTLWILSRRAPPEPSVSSEHLKESRSRAIRAAPQDLALVGPMGELIMNTDTNIVHVHDGITPGGFPLDYSVNVKRFGAKGDGVTDDTKAIQASIDSVSKRGRVFFPGGTYLISETLMIQYSDLWQSVHLEGCGLSSKIVWEGGNNKPMIHVRGPGANGAGFYSKGFIEKLYLYGNAFIGDPYMDVTGIKIGDTPENVFSGVCNFTVRDCLISHVSVGIAGYYESDEAIIHNNYIERYTRYGILNSRGGSGWQITGNHISDGSERSCGVLTSLSSSVIEGNVIQSAQFGIGVQVGSGVSDQAKSVSIRNNYIESQGAAEYGVILYGVDCGVIENNTFNGLKGSTLIYLGDSGGVSCNNINIGPNRHTQSAGFINRLAFASPGSTNCAIMGPQTTDGKVTNIEGPFAYKFLNGNLAFKGGKGIDFSDNGKDRGSVSQVLSEYEHGSFTPTISFGGSSTGIRYAIQDGRYTKIGNRVFVQGTIVLSSKGDAAGDAEINGLPVPSLAAVHNAVPAMLTFRNIGYNATAQALVPPNASKITLHDVTEAGSAGNLSDADFSNSTEIHFYASYASSGSDARIEPTRSP